MRAGKRKINYDRKYNDFFSRANGNTIIQNENGDVTDTIKSIVFVANNFHSEAQQIAKQLKGRNKLETARNIYNFCFSYFQYKEDAAGTDTVRTPNRAWADRKDGIDCDCYSALISCILTNYRWPHIIRMSANYEKDKFGHVYIILLDENNNEICIDPVLDMFNREHSYFSKKDHKMEVSVLNGLMGPQEERRPLAEKPNIIHWIVQNELRNQSTIARAIKVYAQNNALQLHDVENMLAQLLYFADRTGWERLAKQRVVRQVSRRNYSIKSNDVLVYLGLENSNQGLFIALLNDANILELWLENTHHSSLANRIAKGIMEFSKNKANINKIIPFRSVEKYTKKRISKENTPCCTCHSPQAKELIYKQDPASNLIQLSIVINSAEKGKLVKTVRQMYKPDATKASNRLHEKLTQTKPINPSLKVFRDHTRLKNQPLNGWGWNDVGKIFGTVTGLLIGGPAGASIGGALGAQVDNLFGGGSSSKSKAEKDKLYLPGETYVRPDGVAFNPRTENPTTPNFAASLKEFAKQPWGPEAIKKYTEISAAKGGVAPTKEEYQNVISPFIMEAKKQHIELEKANKKRKNIIIGGSLVGVAAVGIGGYLYFKK